ncbi:hypothetical protein Kisp02_61980 [Kineosporia sp. NBRC 101731]|nr:hypothetical protein Kisp02_61980 [Kineosporia sp. NBRC 101731]
MSLDEQVLATGGTSPRRAGKLGNTGLAKPRITCGKPYQDTVRTRLGAHKGPPPFIRIGVRP